jgi:hypothetical protein
MRLILLLASLSLIPILALGAAESTLQGPPVMAPEDLENYHFDNQPETKAPTVKDLNLGQKFILDSNRQNIKDLMTRRLGIVTIKQDLGDLKKIQEVVDRKIIKNGDVAQWQALGVVFGDVLAAELDLNWVSYQDDLGSSKALRWKKTENYVFPVTMLSKRVQYKEKVDVFALFEQIKLDVVAMERYEALHGKI